MFVAHASAGRQPSEAVARLVTSEEEQGLRDAATYRHFAEQVHKSKRNLLDLLIKSRREGKQLVGYGAPGKGNTLLNYCGIRTDLLDYTVDRNTYKHGSSPRAPIYRFTRRRGSRRHAPI